MFNHSNLMIERLAQAHRADRMKEAEISRLPVARTEGARALEQKLALALGGALLAALLIAQLASF